MLQRIFFLNQVVDFIVNLFITLAVGVHRCNFITGGIVFHRLNMIQRVNRLNPALVQIIFVPGCAARRIGFAEHLIKGVIRPARCLRVIDLFAQDVVSRVIGIDRRNPGFIRLAQHPVFFVVGVGLRLVQRVLLQDDAAGLIILPARLVAQRVIEFNLIADRVVNVFFNQNIILPRFQQLIVSIIRIFPNRAVGLRFTDLLIFGVVGERFHAAVRIGRFPDIAEKIVFISCDAADFRCFLHTLIQRVVLPLDRISFGVFAEGQIIMLVISIFRRVAHRINRLGNQTCRVINRLRDAAQSVGFLDQPAVSVVGPLPDRLVIDLFRNFLIYRIVNGLCRMAVGGR